jgi:hypothetical protein
MKTTVVTRKEIVGKADESAKNAKANVDAKASVNNSKETKEVVETISLDEKIAKVERLNKAIEKRELLMKAIRKLNKFSSKELNTNPRITIQDDTLDEFVTYNTEVCQFVISDLAVVLGEKLKAVENEITF